MTSLNTKRKMFLIASSIFLVTMSTVLFLVSEDKLDIENGELHASVLHDDQIENTLNEAEYREIIENEDDDFTIINPDRTFKFISPNLEEIHGYSLENDNNMNVLTFIHPKDLIEFANTLMDYSNEPRVINDTGPIRIQTKTGEFITYMATLIPLFDESGEKELTAVVLQDISQPMGETEELTNND